MDKPGIDGTEFNITIDFGNFDLSDEGLIIGEDIEFIDEPKPIKDGWTYTFKCISEKALKIFYGNINKE